ncbi:hypothetical protein DPMN_087216 [Dreissena polymorpha]|uniref:Uncharacterized protein n=1 Tax=Dreissena polymorpha TaxID=45954 RepID=A0A9D4QWP4_DREPO|nr:hypothetical protein DPMN_087216 [Dreissena polymorpha]
MYYKILSISLRSPRFDTTPGRDEILEFASVLMTRAFVISGADAKSVSGVRKRSAGGGIWGRKTIWSSTSSILTGASVGAEYCTIPSAVLVDTAVNTSAGAEVLIVSMTTGSLRADSGLTSSLLATVISADAELRVTVCTVRVQDIPDLNHMSLVQCLLVACVPGADQRFGCL